MKVEVFEIPFKLIGLNDYINAERTNRFKASAIKKNIEKEIGYYVENSKRKGFLTPHEVPCTLEIEWTEGNMRRDGDNIAFAIKFIQDTLVRHGIFPNDTRKYITELHHTFKTVKGIYKVTVTIKENE